MALIYLCVVIQVIWTIKSMESFQKESKPNLDYNHFNGWKRHLDHNDSSCISTCILHPKYQYLYDKHVSGMWQSFCAKIWQN